MLDETYLDSAFERSRTIEVGKEIPPEEPDDQRRINGKELSRWLFARSKPAADGSLVPIQVWLVGFDIVGDFFFPAPKEGGTIELSFEKCRFRGGLALWGVKGVPSFSISESVIQDDITVAGAGIVGELQIMNVSMRSADIRLNGASLFASGLVCAGGVKLTACEIGKCELLGLDAPRLEVRGGKFGRLSVSVTRLGAAELESFSCESFRITRRGESESTASKGFPVVINDCEIGDEFVIAGLKGVGIKIRETNIHGFAHIFSCELAYLNLAYCKVERDLRFYDLACVGNIHLLRTSAAVFDWSNSPAKDESPKAAARADRFIAYRCQFGEISWRDLLLERDADFTNCVVSLDVDVDRLCCPILRFNNATIDRDVTFSGGLMDGIFFEGSRARSLSFDLKDLEAPVARMELNLAGSSIKSLAFGSEPFAETPVAILPPILNLIGCTYESLPRFPAPQAAEERLAFLKRFAAGGTNPSRVEPQPYFQLARQLRSAGYLSEANQIQYDEREAARMEFWRRGHWRQYAGLTLLCGFIGYGIGTRYFRVLWVVLLLTIVGTLVLAPVPVTGNPLEAWLWRAGASFQEVLPVAKLSPHYAAFFEEKPTDSLNFLQNAYFAFHRFMGWLLASFVVAGLAGLTQRPSSS
ncbi:hypothetical protein UP10_28445 [Bradyrhizobium sp. LTSPM299]|uniref:hypothetical protein n=1 Tax=Bradyrhizobium sp. LTSPM299 TaxID=1619233 RepID=UPI0005CB2CB6|nr:hypothetical protein [Bradyrhizobium sp. LTSPM299]KJC57514.1 hypothetical protein UP10_28445 [Bradyrhizobium sp. LTSPM299]